MYRGGRERGRGDGVRVGEVAGEQGGKAFKEESIALALCTGIPNRCTCVTNSNGLVRLLYSSTHQPLLFFAFVFFYFLCFKVSITSNNHIIELNKKYL